MSRPDPYDVNEDGDWYAALVVEVRQVVDDQPASRVEVARRLGMDRSTLARRLSGRTTWFVEELFRLGDVLGVNVVDLIERSEVAAAR